MPNDTNACQTKNAGGLIAVHPDQPGTVAPENGQQGTYLSEIEPQICAMLSAISRSEAWLSRNPAAWLVRAQSLTSIMHACVLSGPSGQVVPITMNTQHEKPQYGYGKVTKLFVVYGSSSGRPA